MTLAAWALLVGLAATLKGTDFRIALGAAVIIVILHAAWTWHNLDAAQRDAKMMWADYNAARKAAGLPHQEAPT